MCNATTKQILEDVIDSFIADEIMFTAFDVSRESRKCGVKERHRNIRDEIHNIMIEIFDEETSDYTRTMVNIPNTNNRAFVYHNESDDPFDYESPIISGSLTNIGQPVRKISNKSKKKATSTPAPTIVVSTTTTVKGSVRTVKPDKYGRICIPASMVRELGLKAGDEALIEKVGGSYTHRIFSPNSKPSNICVSSSKNYKVDTYDNIRIVTDDKEFVVEFDDNMKCVTVAEK